MEDEDHNDSRTRRQSGRRDHLASLLADERYRQTLKREFAREVPDEENGGSVPSPRAGQSLTEEERAIQELGRRATVRLESNKKLVQVKLKDVSYMVPVQIDAPTKRTVINQSICYFAFEFFQRLAALACGDKQSKKNKTPLSTSDLFTPFTKKAVLSDINLVFEPGETYLILGPPGCGKTSLLKAIAGQLESVDGGSFFKMIKGEDGLKKRPQLVGSIEYNGLSSKGNKEKEQKPLILPNIVSFVGQLDIHAPYLTVKETFDFARNCRMGVSTAIKRKTDNTDNDGEQQEAEEDGEEMPTDSSEKLTIQGLGLAHVADTFVGNNEVRGVSGGQRRRVTLGEMMQGETPVACADEISTGLDAAVTYDICKSIVDFAKVHSTTRIVSLLQPGPETFALFDRVVILSEGQVAYAGPVEDAVEYFEKLGYELPARVDVADFLLSVTTPDGELFLEREKKVEIGEKEEEGAVDSNLGTGTFKSHLTPQDFATAFKESNHYKVIMERLDEKPAPVDWSNTGPPEKFTFNYQNSWPQAVTLNFRRHFTLWLRDWGYIVGKAGENVGMAVATGGILFGRAKLPNSSSLNAESVDESFQELQDAVYGALFMTCLHILLGTSTSAPDAIDQRPIHYKHGDANFYQTTAYVVGQLISTLPQRAIEICAFGIPMYWMVGLDASAESFFLYLALLLAYTFALKMLFGIIAQVFPNKANVLSFGTFLVLIFSLLSGFIVYPDTLPTWLNWAYYMNPMAWTFQGLIINEFQSGKYTVLTGDGSTKVDVGEFFLSTRGFELERVWIGYAFAVLFFILFAAAGVLVAVLQLVRIQPKVSTVTEKTVANMEEESDGEKEDFNFPFVAVDLTFEDLVYEVKTSTGDEILRLLSTVTGGFWAGRMCALMGSSGAGKTTLMDVIALRKTSGTITGEVMLNGFPQERTSFLRSSGYVEQFDVQQAELTVRETVLFCARLRLDSNNEMVSTDEGKQKFVDYVLDMMELTDIAKLPVGNYEEGGLTFEQRKRLAIAVELGASPSVIFLDEPTSGLDSRGAVIIMRAMKKIADTGRTVCATIHQPSSAVFEMFDDLLLLKKGGEVVYHGELGEGSCDLVAYFESKGAKPIQHGENPAAWMLRAYTAENDTTEWKEEFESSEYYEVIKQKIEAVKESPDETKRIQYDEVFAADFRTRTHLMNTRVHKIMARSPSYNLARIMLAIVYAFLVGLPFLYNNSDEGNRSFTENDVNGIVSTIFIALTIMGVVSISMAVPVMKAIRDVFYKHRASGMLEHNSVVIAVTLGELLYIALMSAIFCAVYYATVGLFDSANRWFFFFLFFFLNIAVYVYFGQAFICLLRDIPTAGALVGALIGFNVFFSGLIVQPQYFSGVFNLGFYTAPGRYAYEGTIVSQFVGLNYTVVANERSAYWWNLGCGNVTDDGDVIVVEPNCFGTMEDYVNFFFGGRFTRDNRPLDLGVLFFCLALARFLCWFSLKKFNYVNT